MHAVPQAVNPPVHPDGSGAADDVDDVDEVEDVEGSTEDVDSAEDVDDVDSVDDVDDDALLDDSVVEAEVTVTVVVCKH
jgi:hypothetical protein